MNLTGDSSRSLFENMFFNQQKYEDRAGYRGHRRAIEESGAHRIQRIGNGVEVSNHLQPIGENAHRKEHAADHAGHAEDQPFRRIAPLE